MRRQRSISTFISVLSVSIALLLVSTCAMAQGRRSSKKGRNAVQEKDTTALFNGFAVGVDLVGPVQKVVGDYGQYEASLRINLKDKYFPIIEVGYGQCDHTDDGTNIHYKTNAPYGKLGIDFNVLRDKHDKYRLYVGGRYAITSFKYDLSKPGITDPVWGGEVAYEAKGVKCSYQWIEAVIGVDASILGPLHLGWSVRYRNRTTSDTGDYGNCWYVPGFGKSKKSCLGATFNVTFDI